MLESGEWCGGRYKAPGGMGKVYYENYKDSERGSLAMIHYASHSKLWLPQSCEANMITDAVEQAIIYECFY